VSSLRIDVDAGAVIAALERLGDAAQPYINEAAHVSAESIAAEMRRRLARQLGPTLTPTKSRPDLGKGLTMAGISNRPAYDGNGYVVVDEREPFPNLPLWIEKGTKRGDAGSHTADPRPYFYVSAELEVGAHERRIEQAVQEAIDAEGLGR